MKKCSLCENAKQSIRGGGGGGGGRAGERVGGQGGCERRSEVIVKIQKKIKYNRGWGRGSGGSGLGGVRVDVNKELKFL